MANTEAASMGPPFFTAEIADALPLPLPKLIASMGPPFFTAEITQFAMSLGRN